MHCNSSSVSGTGQEFAGDTVVPDFCGQDPADCPTDWKHMGVSGNLDRFRCMRKGWGFGQDVVRVGFTDSDTSEFCLATGHQRSLKTVSVLATGAMSHHMDL